MRTAPVAEMSFNPVCIVLTYTGSNADEVNTHIQNRTGKPFSGSLEEGKHYAVFMGQVHVLDNLQLRSAMGRV